MWTPLLLLPWVGRPNKRHVQRLALVLGLWFVFLWHEGDLWAPWSTVQDSTMLKVVSLNCAGGSAEAMREALKSSASIVLLQEVPPQSQAVAVANECGYAHAAFGRDCAVLSFMPLKDVRIGREFVAASVDCGPTAIRVISLRLSPPVFRLDLWSPQAWRDYASDLAARKAEFKSILSRAEIVPSKVWIIGGDFNTTNPRVVTDALPQAREAMRTTGRSWRGTGTNEFPFAQIDQLWSAGWASAHVVRIQSSDHRMLVALTKPLY